MQGERHVSVANRHTLLRHNIACIGALGHAMQGDASLFLTVDQHPVQRCATTVFRQQRTVQVECAFCRQA